MINIPAGHWFNLPQLNTAQMYDRTQTDMRFKDGSVFVCNDNKTIGMLSRAWPVAVYGETGELHNLTLSSKKTIKEQLPETFATMETLAKFFNLTEIESKEEL